MWCGSVCLTSRPVCACVHGRVGVFVWFWELTGHPFVYGLAVIVPLAWWSAPIHLRWIVWCAAMLCAEAMDVSGTFCAVTLKTLPQAMGLVLAHTRTQLNTGVQCGDSSNRPHFSTIQVASAQGSLSTHHKWLHTPQKNPLEGTQLNFQNRVVVFSLGPVTLRASAAHMARNLPPHQATREQTRLLQVSPMHSANLKPSTSARAPLGWGHTQTH